MVGGYLVLLLTLLGVGAATGAVVVAGMALALLMPPRMTDGKAVWLLRRLSPGDLGLGFEDVAFSVRDDKTGQPMRIAGWWIPHPAAGGRCVVLLHGYADAKVGAIAWAPSWHALGFNVLAIDLRAHGESEGVHCTAGFWERHDVDQTIDRLRAQRPAGTRKIVLFGLNVGAAVAVATAAMRDDVAALVLVDPPADFPRAAMTQMDRAGAPGRIFQHAALAIAEWIARCDFSAVRPAALVRRVRCPILMIDVSCPPRDGVSIHPAMDQAIRARRRDDDDVYFANGTGSGTEVGDRMACQARMENFLKALRE
jgi:pimeloyl-ACP methyl ester carboxylesterase